MSWLHGRINIALFISFKSICRIARAISKRNLWASFAGNLLIFNFLPVHCKEMAFMVRYLKSSEI